MGATQKNWDIQVSLIYTFCNVILDLKGELVLRSLEQSVGILKLITTTIYKLTTNADTNKSIM